MVDFFNAIWARVFAVPNSFWNVVQGIAALGTIVVACWVLLKFGIRWIAWLWLKATRKKPRIPKETLKIVPEPSDCVWYNAPAENPNTAVFRARLYVTNIHARPTHILSCFHVQSGTYGDISRLIERQNQVIKTTTLKRQETGIFFATFLSGRVYRPQRTYRATLILIDQYSNKHKVGKIFFKPLEDARPRKKEKPSPKKVESTYALTDPLEKQIVAILKHEIMEYRKSGRRIGGLGSLKAPVGTPGSRELGQSVRGTIISKGTDQSLASENALTLIALINRSNPEQRSNALGYLLKRLSRELEYCCVAYFIVYVLHHADSTMEALETCHVGLLGDDEHGFSNALMLAASVLKYEPNTFSDELLDHLEQFITRIQEEDLFGMLDKINELRAFRAKGRLAQ